MRIRKMLIYCVKLDHALYSINYSIYWGGGGAEISKLFWHAITIYDPSPYIQPYRLISLH